MKNKICSTYSWCVVTAVLLSILKITGIIHWSWFIVLIPLYAPLFLGIIAGGLIMLIILICIFKNTR